MSEDSPRFRLPHGARRSVRRPKAFAVVLGVFLLSLAFSETSNAALITITFDDLPGMSNIPGLTVPGASQLSDHYLSLTGALFGSSSPFVAVVDLASLGISSPNSIGGVNAPGGLSYSDPIEVSFFDVANGMPGVTDFVSIRGDQVPIAGTATLEAFGLDGTSLGSFTADDVVGGLTLTLAMAGIHRVVLSETSGTIAFDNLAFNTPTAVTTMPEASLLLLFATGVIGLLARTRRRRRASPVPRSH